jgi:MFS transporter, FHS family, glucose/mannose:H+ symporter
LLSWVSCAIADVAMGENHSLSIGQAEACSGQRGKQFALLMHFGFLLVGVVGTLLGPILPMLAARWRVGDAEVSWLFVAQFSGGIIGSALSSRMIARVGLLRLLTYGYAATAVAVACLGVSSWALGLLSVFSFGFALGLMGPVMSLLMAEVYANRRAAALNVLGFAWALGAVAGPPMITLFARDGGLVRPLGGLAIMLLGVALVIAWRALVDSPSGSDLRSSDRKNPAHLEGSPRRSWRSLYALLTGALIFIYVGTETATSGWIATYAQRLSAPTNEFGTMTPSVFWLGLLIGRGVAPAVLTLMSEAALVLVSLFVGGAGLLIILFGSNLVSVTLGVGMTGLGLAAIFPTTFAIFTRYFGAQSSELSGSFFVVGGLGGALIPLLVGFVSGRTGDLRLGLLVPALGVAAMIVLQLCILQVLARRRS